ncbi:permease [candidate division WOR-3 bacterium]|uniref:Permease n=1 Tax=candidate division WOR-3 bacterium TaxID=2052148 RepID=A0A660SKY7_UNCW3|nr:MAG: permease [candidate division WOR-3 bacterium]
MGITALVINCFALTGVILAFLKDRQKAQKALMVAWKSFFHILPMVFIIIIIIGLLMGFIPRGQIAKIVGKEAGFGGILIVALLGAVLHIPSLISFPLAASLLKSGASITAVAVFITTLTMIGMVTLPLEIKEMGKRMAFLRNGLSLIIAIIIGLIMGKVL